MKTEEERIALITSLLRLPKSWTSLQQGLMYHDEMFWYKARNDRIHIFAQAWKGCTTKSGWWWDKKETVHPDRFKVEYKILGPDKNPIASGTLPDETYALIEAMFHSASIDSLKGVPWSTGKPCSYCGSPRGAGACDSCGSK